jgi:pimeloyl-ACP methyl ester carboxylesterase
MRLRSVPRRHADQPFNLRVHDGGDQAGTSALLLHGFPQHAALWDGCLTGLHAIGLRTLAVDQRGYSPDPQPREAEAYRLTELVEDAAAVLDEAEVDRAIVVGHDWGAAVGWALAAWHPERVSGLVALSVPHPGAFGRALASDPEQQHLSRYIRLFRQPGTAEHVLLEDDARRLRAFFDGSGLDARAVDQYVVPLLEEHRLSAALAWYRAMTGPLFAELPAVTVPTVYVSAERDLGVGRVAAAGCADFVTGPYRRVDVEGGSHWIVDQHPELVVEAVASLR